jgi:hypothetical protein
MRQIMMIARLAMIDRGMRVSVSELAGLSEAEMAGLDEYISLWTEESFLRDEPLPCGSCGIFSRN